MTPHPQDFPLASPLDSGATQAKPRKAAPLHRELLHLGGMLAKVLGVFAVISLPVAIARFPSQTDPIGNRSIPRPDNYAAFYGSIYKAPDLSAPVEKQDDAYVRMAQQAIEDQRIVPRVQEFVRTYGLEKARVLDVGSGTGYLQDVVENYVGLDISPTASRYYHKPFIEASATEMPLPDSDFDAVWTVWVLEHVPHPEQALAEIRRVVKNGGLLYLNPAWNCSAFAAKGAPVRPMGDLDLAGKLDKVLYYAQQVPPLEQMEQSWIRLGLMAKHLGQGPTDFHYRPIEPNYKEYWMPDSDAINALDRQEMARWFTSRGDECLNCGDVFLNPNDELIIRVHK